VNPDEIGIKSPVESDLQFDAGCLHFLKGTIDVRKRVIDRFLAEDMFPCARRSDYQIGVGCGWRTYQDSIDRRIAQDFLAVCGYAGNSATFCHLLRRIAVNVSNCGRRRFGDAERQALSMHPADPAGANDSDTEFLLPHSLSPSQPLREIMFN
jgi:hypothetical protein